jgi:hypothetical protein
VREALLRAKEPAPLLFEDLPVACGRAPFEAHGAPTETAVEGFVEELRTLVRELQLAYPKLLDTIESAIRTGLSLPSDPATLRRELVARAERLLPYAVDAQLKALLIRAGEHDMPREEWLVSLGTLLGGKPPDAWHDDDIDRMRLNLGVICRRFASLESMLLDRDDSHMAIDPMLLRVTVAQLGEIEQERVVPLRPVDHALVTSMRGQIRTVIDAASSSLSRDAIVAALALVTRDMIMDMDGRAGP